MAGWMRVNFWVRDGSAEARNGKDDLAAVPADSKAKSALFWVPHTRFSDWRSSPCSITGGTMP